MPNTNVNVTEDSLPDNNTNANPISIQLEAKEPGPLSQSRNAIFGQIIGVGCIIRILFSYINEKFIAATLSVAVSILIIQLTKTLHAPGSATAFNIIMTTTNFSWYSFQYIVMPTVIGTIILLIIAVIINNLSPKRHYSLPWW